MWLTKATCIILWKCIFTTGNHFRAPLEYGSLLHYLSVFLYYRCSPRFTLSSFSFELLSSRINNVSWRIEESPLTALMQAATKGNSDARNRSGEPRSVDSTGGVVCTKIGCFSQSKPAGQGQTLTLTVTGLCQDTIVQVFEALPSSAQWETSIGPLWGEIDVEMPERDQLRFRIPLSPVAQNLDSSSLHQPSPSSRSCQRLPATPSQQIWLIKTWGEYLTWQWVIYRGSGANNDTDGCWSVIKTLILSGMVEQQWDSKTIQAGVFESRLPLFNHANETMNTTSSQPNHNILQLWLKLLLQRGSIKSVKMLRNNVSKFHQIDR